MATPTIASALQVRISRDGGRTYPTRHGLGLLWLRRAANADLTRAYQLSSHATGSVGSHLSTVSSGTDPWCLITNWPGFLTDRIRPARRLQIPGQAGKDAGCHLFSNNGRRTSPLTQRGPH
jgi:hypothetical protein